MVAPMLTSGETYYSNFRVNPKTDDELFLPIYTRKSLGCFKVFGLHDCYLLDLKDKQLEALLDASSNKPDDTEFSALARSNSKLIYDHERYINI